MMPINWLMVFFMCLFCLIMLIILINSLILIFKMKDKKNFLDFLNKKWKWFW
uniref:ATP synthase F0 subunit 8 n=1 Tax=Bombus pascuorum TaxID=65598 RepID=A0A0S2LT28_BOMPA|nr:ATP synthase F0 subunit 8 [Bombus pascuorum]